MSFAWLALVAVANPVSELPRSEREVMALVVRAPSLTGERRAETFDALRDELEGLTPFRIEDLSEHVRESDDPLASIATAAASRYRRVPDLVLALSILAAPDAAEAQISWQLIRAKEAASARDQSFAEGTPSPDLSGFVEAFALFDVAVHALPGALVTPLIEGLKPSLEAKGLWRPRGRLLVKLPRAGFVLRLDRHQFSAETTELEIADVQVGLREVQLEHPDYQPLRERLKVEPELVTSWQAQPIARALEEARTPRAVVLASGLAMLAAGSAFLVVSAIQSAEPSPRCLSLPGDPPCGATDDRFARLGPIPTAPLGYSLAIAGGVLAGGVLLSEETTHPWWWTALGLGLGAASFTVSVLAE